MDERKGIWKSGKGRGRNRPKGRQLDDAALAEVRRLLGDRPRRRDLLIEFLHLIQDAHGHLSAGAPPRARRGDAPRPGRGLGGRDLLRPFRRGEGRRDPAAAPSPSGSATCSPASSPAPRRSSRRCAPAPTRPRVRVVARALHGPLRRGADGRGRPLPRRPRHPRRRSQAAIAERPRAPRDPRLRGSRRLPAGGGYADAPRAPRGRRGRRGGRRGAPRRRPARAGRRRLSHRAQVARGAGQPGPRYLAVNGDEGEPGTFKDRYYLERTPHLMLEGMLIAAWAVEAERWPSSTCATNTRRSSRSCAARSPRSRRRASSRPATSSSAAAPAPTSAARSRRCSS